MKEARLPCRELIEILLPAYGPCPAFKDICREMRWAPEEGHAPRGFCGATGRLKDVKLILIMAEPGDPHNGESNLAGTDPDELIYETFHYSYHCYETGKDRFHQNVQYILDLFWPGLGFDEKMRRTWITESVLCSAKREGGNIPARICRECSRRYLKKQLDLLGNAIVVAIGSKARDRTKGIPGIQAVGAAAPPGCNRKGVRESWEKIAALFNSNEGGKKKSRPEKSNTDKLKIKPKNQMAKSTRRKTPMDQSKMEGISKMTWHHQKVYDALFKKGNYQKEGKRDVYVSLDHHTFGDLSMVLYRQDSETYKSSPLHVNKSRSGFSADLFQKILPAIQKTSRGEPEWVRYKVKDWDKFVEAIGLRVK